MKENKKKSIRTYCEDKGITLQELYVMILKADEGGEGISYSHLDSIKDVCTPSIKVETVIKIYNGTKAIYGEGLTPWEYIENLEEFYK